VGGGGRRRSDARRAGGLPRAVVAGLRSDRPGVAAQDRGGLVEAADARPPSRPLHEPACRLDLGPHRPGGEVHPAQLRRRGAADRARLRRAPPGLHLGHIREHEQEVGTDLLGEQRRGQVLVDHGLDPREARRREHDRDPAAACTDDQHPGVEQEPDRLDLDDPGRLRRRHDAADMRPVGPHRPAALGGQPHALLGLIDRADRLRRHRECGVRRVDHGLREQRRDSASRRELVQERLIEEITDHALRLRAEDVERVGLHVVIGLRLERQEADLWSVAMGDDEAVRFMQRGDRPRRGPDVGLLVGCLRRLAPAQKRVPAERDDGQGSHRSPQARRMYA